jgi:hypothetical protein
MNKFFASAFAGAMLASFASFNAQAFPVSPSPSVAAAPDVTLVAGGCGIGLHRGPHGGCRVNGAVAVAPVVVAPVVTPGVVVCPLGTHPGPAGRRCIRN